MQGKNSKTGRWTMLLAALMLTAACSHDAAPEPTVPDSAEPTLRIYVYSPEHPIVTRADNGQVTPTGTESEINTLQIWVFRHDDGSPVAYYSPSSVELLNSNASETYEVVVSKAFAKEKPRVDVYVVANAALSNCGNEFDENTTRDELDNARMAHDAENDYFGLTALTTEVPEAGLPKSGVLKNQPVIGESPVLRIGTEEQMATVRLIRSVSKVRFVFSNAVVNTEKLFIESVRLAGSVIPTEEYLFLNDDYAPRSFRIGSEYETATAMLAENLGEVTTYSTDPRQFDYANQTGQDYEALIDDGIDNGQLTAQGPFYLRESDRKLRGSISYHIDEGATQTISFEMAEEGDFSRNHTWIVYAYYYGGDNLRLSTAYIRLWTEEDREHQFYNW